MKFCYNFQLVDSVVNCVDVYGVIFLVGILNILILQSINQSMYLGPFQVKKQQEKQAKTKNKLRKNCETIRANKNTDRKYQVQSVINHFQCTEHNYDKTVHNLRQLG